MLTTITNWFLVDLINESDDQPTRTLETILWGDIYDDQTGRFSPGDYVCTNFIATRDGNTFITKSGSTYIGVGSEKHVEVNIFDLPVLRQGISPSQLKDIKHVLSVGDD